MSAKSGVEPEAFDLEAEAQELAARRLRARAVDRRAKEIIANSHGALDAVDGLINRGELRLDAHKLVQDLVRNVEQVGQVGVVGHDDSSTLGQPDTAHATNVEVGARGGQNSGPHANAATDGPVA